MLQTAAGPCFSPEEDLRAGRSRDAGTWVRGEKAGGAWGQGPERGPCREMGALGKGCRMGPCGRPVRGGKGSQLRAASQAACSERVTACNPGTSERALPLQQGQERGRAAPLEAAFLRGACIPAVRTPRDAREDTGCTLLL